MIHDGAEVGRELTAAASHDLATRLHKIYAEAHERTHYIVHRCAAAALSSSAVRDHVGGRVRPRLPAGQRKQGPRKADCPVGEASKPGPVAQSAADGNCLYHSIGTHAGCDQAAARHHLASVGPAVWSGLFPWGTGAEYHKLLQDTLTGAVWGGAHAMSPLLLLHVWPPSLYKTTSTIGSGTAALSGDSDMTVPGNTTTPESRGTNVTSR